MLDEQLVRLPLVARVQRVDAEHLRTDAGAELAQDAALWLAAARARSGGRGRALVAELNERMPTGRQGAHAPGTMRI